jgi:cystathionine beta-synthase
MDVAHFVGSIRENALLDRIFRDPDALQADVAEVMAPPIAMLEFDEPVDVAFETLQHGPAILVVKAGQALGVLTRSDLLEFLAHRPRA